MSAQAADQSDRETVAFRGIEADARQYRGVVPPASCGRPPKLKWIAISALVIDPDYQRPITETGHRNVRRIAAEFDWIKFAPVVVAAAGGNRFAIVDGQHRTTAAKLIGIDKVPCAIIDAARAQQAMAFRAINGNVTKISSLQHHHAAVVAGDPDALHLTQVCKHAGVAVARYPVPWNEIKAGQTLAPKVTMRALARFGDGPVVAALDAIVHSGDGNAGMLRGPIIVASARVLAAHREWRGAALRAAYDTIDLEELLKRASKAAARTPGSSVADQLEGSLAAALDDYFEAAGRKRRA
jgi:hypothetical protein